MTTPPRLVDIDGNRFEVRIVATKDWTYDQLMGQIAYSELVIRVLDGMKPDATRDTVLHEIVHGVFKSRIPDRPWRELAGKHAGEVMETVVEALSSGMLQVLRKNPQLVTWLLEDENA